ncbi:hypothetical protein LTR84_000632 [Exophiala bonariae]|uniref:Uncharacterized protein n=1 Tax=Exophiala bonariae TaxID=1690606 RepID=A0AAV9NRG3_9EURO|nr:hypothetical protein LTR84_000632 [Exophiala bonariae]
MNSAQLSTNNNKTSTSTKIKSSGKTSKIALIANIFEPQPNITITLSKTPPVNMSATAPYTSTANKDYSSGSEDGQAAGKRKALTTTSALPLPPSSDRLSQPAGQLLKGATDENGQLKAAALMVGIKLDLEAEVHLTARVRGDITIGLY